MLIREFELQKQKINHVVVARITNTTEGCYYIQYLCVKKMKIVEIKIYNCRSNDLILYLAANLQCYSS